MTKHASGLVAADQQALANALQTIRTVRAWSPAVHRCFPRDEREAIVETRLELRKAGLPNDVVVGHLLPSMFTAPWVEEAYNARHARRMREMTERTRALFRARMGPGHPGLMNAGAVARREGRAAATD